MDVAGGARQLSEVVGDGGGGILWWHKLDEIIIISFMILF